MNEEIKNEATTQETTETALKKKTHRREEFRDSAAYIDAKEARKKECKERWMKERERKSKPVTGKFLFNECPGGEIIFRFGEFPGEPRKTYTMRHDNIYTIPLGVAIHLNDNCSYSEFQHNLDAGKAVNAEQMYVQSKIHRTNFIPMDWSQDVGNTTGKSIAQVTYGNPLDNRYNLDATGR